MLSVYGLQLAVSGFDQVQFLSGSALPLATNVAALRRLGSAEQHAGCMAYLRGLVLAASPDQTTFAWMEGRPGAPEDLDEAIAGWRELPSDSDARFDREVTVDASALSPMV